MSRPIRGAALLLGAAKRRDALATRPLASRCFTPRWEFLTRRPVGQRARWLGSHQRQARGPGLGLLELGERNAYDVDTRSFEALSSLREAPRVDQLAA